MADVKTQPKLVKAVAKGVSHSPRKVSEVASLVRNRTVADALIILMHTPRRAATAVEKTISSAKANAEHNHNLKPDTLKITGCWQHRRAEKRKVRRNRWKPWPCPEQRHWGTWGRQCASVLRRSSFRLR